MNRKSVITGIVILSTFAASALGRGDEAYPHERSDPEEIVVNIVSDYDSNADNLMSAAELEAAIVGLHEKRKEAFESMAGKRREGGNFEDRRGPRGGPPTASEVAARLIENHDENGDDQLDTEEMRGAVRALKPKGPRGIPGRGHHRGGPRQSPPTNPDVE